MMQELSLNILDLAQNSVSAGASHIEIAVCEDQALDLLEIVIEDNGRGMDAELLRQVESPFVTTRTTRKVGLGIPMIKQCAEDCGGEFEIRSAPGAGTRLMARFGLRHIDRPPLGDLGGTILALFAMSAPDVDFSFVYTVDGEAFSLSTREIKQVLGQDVPLATPEVAQWMRDALYEGIKALHGGA